MLAGVTLQNRPSRCAQRTSESAPEDRRCPQPRRVGRDKAPLLPQACLPTTTHASTHTHPRIGGRPLVGVRGAQEEMRFYMHREFERATGSERDYTERMEVDATLSIAQLTSVRIVHVTARVTPCPRHRRVPLACARRLR